MLHDFSLAIYSIQELTYINSRETGCELATVLEELGDLIAAQEHQLLANRLLKEPYGPDHKYPLRQNQRYQDILERNALTPWRAIVSML